MRFVSRYLAICLWAMAVWLWPGIGVGGAWAATIDSVSMQQVDGRTQVTLTYSTRVATPKIFALDGGKPRVVIDVRDAKRGALPKSPIAGQGAASSIRHADREKGTRLVIDLAVSGRLSTHDHTGKQTVITLFGETGGAVATVAPTPSPTSEAVSIALTRQSQKSAAGVPIPRVKPKLSVKTARKPIIVIDPGHGGYDPGAIGGAGTKEKSVTLKAAKELQKQLLKTGRYDVVLTRTKDVYVIHDERVRIARIRDADLFISIHADSLERRSTRGASVYTLADHARKRSTKLVDSQNWIMDIDLRDKNNMVGDILVDLAQRKTFSNSDQFAEMLVPELAKVTPILGNTHRRAGLAVLLAPDVPAVLLEMGFISNAQDEKALNSAAHRKKTMRAVTNAIDRYFSVQNQ